MNTKGKVVIKLGSATLARADGRIDYEFIQTIADQLAQVKQDGWQPIIVSSGAISCGLEALGITQRPSDLPSLQAAASVGQNALSAAYATAFKRYGILTSLVLLTRRDTADRTAYLHARDTFARLLELGVVPVVNENDTISVEQIKFGDNDTLAALVACLVGAEKVIIMSDIDGFYDADPGKNPDARLLPRVEYIDQAIMDAAGDSASAFGTGGMITKIKAARVLMAAGSSLVICDGHAPRVIERICAGEELGTLFISSRKPHEITPRKLWIALGDSVKGAIIVDDGARAALEHKGSSLLSVGIRAVEGSFNADDIVDVKDSSGYLFARGRVSASSDETSLALGRTQEQLASNRLLKSLADKPIIHRNELIVF